MWSINEFCEQLDHEFDGIKPLPDNLRGVRIDEDWGLKQHCERRELKSVDFLVHTNAGYSLLEFTDIGRQIDSTLQAIKQIDKSSDMPKTLKRDMKNRVRKAVSQEAREKYMHTCLIFSHAQGYLCDTPPISNGCRLLIVYAPFGEHLHSSDVELSRFLGYMKDSLVTAIPDAMFHKVEIITLGMFLECFVDQ